MAEYLSHKKDLPAEEYNAAMKLKAKAEHRLGQVLATTVKPRAGAGRPKKIGDTVSPIKGQIPKEVTRKQSSRAQQLARVSWEKIEEAFDSKSEKGERASPAERDER